MVEIPQQEFVSIADLKADGQNPNRMTDRQRKSLAESITRYGFIVPIITNKDLLIADGEQRWEVAKGLGMTQVPVIRLPVEDVDRRLLRQVLNKLRGEHELLLDAQEFDRIISMGHEDDLKQLLDLSDSQIERYLNEIREPKEETYEIPEIEKIQTDIKRGDIFQLSKHRLMCGDATNKEDVQALMDGNKAELLITDPPYGVEYKQGKFTGIEVQSPFPKIVNDDLKGVKLFQFLCLAFKNIYDYLADGSPCYIFSPSMTPSLAILYAAIETGFHMQSEIIWVKPSFILGRADYYWQHEKIWYGYKNNPHKWFGKRNLSTVWEMSRVASSKYEHPTQKPIPLIKNAIFNSSDVKAHIVDMFGGSGSTLIACEQTDRICYMMEIEPRYCEIIARRWEAYTGQKAVKISEKDVSKSNN